VAAEQRNVVVAPAAGGFGQGSGEQAAVSGLLGSGPMSW
jgi:hypothetical protein